jgi:hypothetical protein
LDIQAIVKELKRERDRLNTAIVALEGADLPLTPPKASPVADVPAPPAKKRRRLTPEGRKRLSDMMKKRWAERRKSISRGAK